MSEPLDSERGNWKQVPPGFMIVAPAGRPVTLEPFLAEHRQAAEKLCRPREGGDP